jgi:FKBP-type peptidyl-prolyl cis-trans isomerase FklB
VAHYAGTLIDGKKFDNSYDRGQPLTIPVGGVIKGWTEILQLMHIGDKWKVYIPSELGYGERGAGADIPGGATLIFEMELLEVKKAGVAETAPTEEKKD